MPMNTLSGARIRQPTRRSMAKQATREKILTSARDLFTLKGYEGATIRDIASAAGMSTGAVFANFNDKAELFSEILDDRTDVLVSSMREAATGTTAEARLLNLFVGGYQFNFGDLPLLQAAMSVSWSPVHGPEQRRQGGHDKVVGVISEVIEQAILDGGLISTAPATRLAKMLWDLFLASFHRASSSEWDMDEMHETMRGHIDIVLSSFRAR